MSFLAEFWRYLQTRDTPWLRWFMIVFLILALLLIVAGESAVAPFIYSLY